jgi:hypothetical protein
VCALADVSEYGPRDRSARETRKDKGLSYQRRLRNRQAKKAQRELDGLDDNFDEERVAREEYNKEHGTSCVRRVSVSDMD